MVRVNRSVIVLPRTTIRLVLLPPSAAECTFSGPLSRRALRDPPDVRREHAMARTGEIAKDDQNP
jgi:hypothetical protein